MFERLRSFVPWDRRGEIVGECRDCGTAVDRAEWCPSCGSPRIARYEID